MADYAIHDTTLVGIADTIRKKDGTSALIDPADYEDRINLMGMLEVKSASGAIASFSDGADGVPVKSCVVSFLPSGGGGTPSAPVAITGVSGLSVTQLGKNLMSASPTLTDNRYITYWGNHSASGANDGVFLKAGTYTITFTKPSSMETANFGVYGAYTEDKTQITIIGNTRNNPLSNQIVVPKDGHLNFWIYGTANEITSADVPLITCQIEVGSTATTYEAYVTPSVVTDTFGQTIYGGTRDLTTDKVSVTWGYIASYNGETLTGRWVSSMDTYVAGTTPTTGAEVAYELATPTEITGLTPHEIDTLYGDNNIYADTGTTEVEYRSSGTETIITPTLVTKNITDNGTYNASSDNADGYSSVTVALPLGTKQITENGTYQASADSLKGFSSVTVDVGSSGFSPLFTETLIGDNSSHASSFTLSEAYDNYDMVKIVWYESASSSGFLYTTPDILDEIFTVGIGKICINKPSTNYYVCYTKSGLTWTQTNQRTLYVHEIYGVTFTNCTMQATDLYKRGASTTDKYAITSQTSLKDYDMFVMSSIHATDGSETMPTTWLYQYPQENISGAFSCPIPTVLQEYNANDEAFVISEYGMTSARFFMVQGIKFTAI